MKAGDMAAGVTNFTLDAMPVQAYDGMLTSDTLTADELKYFKTPLDFQSNLDESPDVQLCMLNEKRTRAIIEVSHNSQTEALFDYLNSHERSALLLPETVPTVPITNFSRETYEHQEERPCVREVVSLENIYALPAEETSAMGNLQMETCGSIMQPNMFTGGNQWQSGNYMYCSEPLFTTTTSSNAVVSPNQQYYYPLDISSLSGEFIPPMSDVMASSYQNFAAFCTEEPTITRRTQIAPLLFTQTISQDVHTSETSFPTDSSSNDGMVSAHKQEDCTLDMNSLCVQKRSMETKIAESETVDNLEIQTLGTVLQLNTITAENYSQTDNHMYNSEPSFLTNMTSNTIVSPNQQHYRPSDISLLPSECVHSTSYVTGFSLARSVAMDSKTFRMLPQTPPVTFSQSVPQGGEFSGGNSVMDTTSLSLYFPKDNAKGGNCTKLKYFRCAYCSYVSSVSTNFKNHVRIHTGEKPYVCKICKKRFIQGNCLISHMHIHSGEKLHKCNSSIKSFNFKYLLKQYTRTHTGEKPYACSVCNKRFTNKSYLFVHYQIHSGGKPYACNICEKRFRRKNQLNTHVRTHTVQIS